MIPAAHARRQRGSPALTCWLWMDSIPPELGLTREQRAKVKQRLGQMRGIRAVNRTAARAMAKFLIAAIGSLSLLFGVWVLLIALRRIVLPGVPYIALLVATILLFQAALWLVITYAWRHWSVPLVRRALCECGHPVCIECGYIRTGLERADAPCPECAAVPANAADMAVQMQQAEQAWTGPPAWAYAISGGSRMSRGQRIAIRKRAAALSKADPQRRRARVVMALVMTGVMIAISLAMVAFMIWVARHGGGMIRVVSLVAAPVLFNVVLWIMIIWASRRVNRKYVAAAMAEAKAET